MPYKYTSKINPISAGRPTTPDETADLLLRVIHHLNDMGFKVANEFTNVSRANKTTGTMVVAGGRGGRGSQGSPPGTLTVRRVDSRLAIDNVRVIELKQDDGLTLTEIGLGTARVGAEIATIIITIVASENVPAFRVITSGGNIADSTFIAHRGRVVGITLEAIASGFSGLVAKEGKVENPAWSWATGDILYLNGTALSTAAPSSGFSQAIGVAKNATTVIVRLGIPILL